MRAVTQSDSPPHSHSSLHSKSAGQDPRRRSVSAPIDAVVDDSPLTEQIDALISRFTKRVATRSDALCAVLRNVFERDDDSRSASLAGADESDRKRTIRRLAAIVFHHRALQSLLAGDPRSRARIESIGHSSFQTACVAGLIAQRERRVDPVEAFACGMLGDVGSLVLAVEFPKAMERVERAMRSGERDVLAVETHTCGVDHAVVGGSLLARWLLPDVLQQVARADALPLDLEAADVSCARHLAIVRDAKAILKRACHTMSRPSDANERELLQAKEQLVRDIEQELNRLDRTPADVGAVRGEQARPAANVKDDVGAVSMAHLYRFMLQVAELPGRVSGVDGLCVETAGMVFDLLGVARMVVFAQVDATQFRTCRLDGTATVDGTAPAAEPVVDSQRAIVRSPVTGYAGRSAVGDETIRIQNADDTEYAELADRFVRFLGPGPIDCLAFQCGSGQPGGILFSTNDDGWRWNRLDSASLRSISVALGAAFESMLSRRRLQSQASIIGDVAKEEASQRQAAVQTEMISRIAQLAAGAAHELNNPLAIIAGRAQLLQADPQNKTLQADLQLIAAQARRAGDMVMDLMEYARPAQPQPVRIRLFDWANRLRQRWYRRSALDADQIQIRLHAEDLVVFADERQLDTSADEIMANAVEALRQKNGPCATKSGELPNIQINSPSTSTDDTIVVAISDNGRGMPPGVSKHALDPFFSHRAAGRRQGLGLSRAARYIEINGGRLWIESTEGEGTTVRFALPSSSAQPLAH